MTYPAQSLGHDERDSPDYYMNYNDEIDTIEDESSSRRRRRRRRRQSSSRPSSSTMEQKFILY